MSSDECTSRCSSPPTPSSPLLPVSVGPGRRRYMLSPSPSPSPPFSPPSQPSSPETTPLLYRTQTDPQSPPPAALHLEALFWQEEEAPSSPPSWSLKDW
ncbi:unnamed protein product [Spirodela intermedia]|uniref:Uncharacterized protein n=2 Tax=Spirodela intermedia TaxID=51605 RepID=A0A7I8IT53_SPIIN|nr:unnamed protein product [Spirodela intermedia]CAA6660315.1 unnamed protein product [Spirodela intermedia]CAA7396650.1 unnamed protein product [Spirodela intermedia]